MPQLTILPDHITQGFPSGTNLLAALRQMGRAPDAPCGGNGTCGKCRVSLDGCEVLACRTVVNRDMTVTLPKQKTLHVLGDGMGLPSRLSGDRDGFLLAFDIGTTSLVCYLLDGKTGAELSHAGMRNPQTVFGADVISRIQGAIQGELPKLQNTIRDGMTSLAENLCSAMALSPEKITVVSVVGNPAMQQLFLGISPKNLVIIPFAPVLTEAKAIPCKEFLPLCSNAELLIVPDISGYVGADTIGCILATGLHESEEITLLVDIGTNGELVLGNHRRMIACATAAGPALEGASILFGMRAADGAIDHVWIENGFLRYSVIGNTVPIGICGSGLIDAVAVLLELGLLNKRGRIQTTEEIDGQRVVHLTDKIYLTQEDIRQVQLAKGAIHAGLSLMATQLGIRICDIDQVLLAGAFGSFLNPHSACRIGLLPEELEERITAVGNAAGTGAKILACDSGALLLTQKLAETIEFLELASLPSFSRTFAKSMNFREEHP